MLFRIERLSKEYIGEDPLDGSIASVLESDEDAFHAQERRCSLVQSEISRSKFELSRRRN